MMKRHIGESSPLALINNKVYEVISVEKGWYRIIDETGKDYLYSPELFENVGEILNRVKRDDFKIDDFFGWLDDVEIIDEDSEENQKMLSAIKEELFQGNKK